MPHVLLPRTFLRQAGGAPPPAALGSDGAPGAVTPTLALENAGSFEPRSGFGDPVKSVVVGVTSAAAGPVTVEVYQADETLNLWYLVGSQAIPAGQLRRFPVVCGSFTTKICCYVRPLAAGAPAGEYRFHFGPDQVSPT